MRHATASLIVSVNISACMGTAAPWLSRESGNLPDAIGKWTLKR
jgi:hypothetical protein